MAKLRKPRRKVRNPNGRKGWREEDVICRGGGASSEKWDLLPYVRGSSPSYYTVSRGNFDLKITCIPV